MVHYVSQQSDVLLYDGDCTLCSRSMRFLKKRMKKPLQIIAISESKELIASLPEEMQTMDSMYLIRKGRPYAESGAAIRCLLYLGLQWRVLFPFAWLVPSFIRDRVYRFVSSRRHSSSSSS